MATDITRLDEDELLPKLGDGEWVIAMPEGYADFHVSAQWRDAIMVWVGVRYVRWVLNGEYYRIDHESDPHWDHSGEARRQIVDPQFLRTRYDTLVEWLDNEYTGQWIPTYTSGFGKDWETYGDVVEEHIRECLVELCRIGFTDDSDDVFWDDTALVMTQVEQALLMTIRYIPTEEVWKRFETLVHQQITEEKRAAAKRSTYIARMRDFVQEFWQTYFSDIQRTRIERPQFVEMRLEERLRESLLDADPDVVAAIVEVGLPGIFSNSVAAHIKIIARDAQG
ncbi:MAG: hypothetical protein K8I82_14035 [Anaerolineae bacterium]|nr:hypothetical protein [Anaerolineae bacterium]